MDEWDAIFEAVQRTVRTAGDFEEGLRQVIEFARSYPELFDEPDYWDEVKTHEFGSAWEAVTGWAKEGLESLGPGEGWEFLILDLGDCPEIFRLYRPGSQGLMSEAILRNLLLTEGLIGTDFAGCFAPEAGDPFTLLFGPEGKDLTDHNVAELDDDVLSWNERAGFDDHGWNGYLLWLAFGSMALREPLREKEYCRRVLNGRDRLYLLYGFEEIFCYFATLTPEGLRFENDLPPAKYPLREPPLQEPPNSPQLRLPYD